MSFCEERWISRCYCALQGNIDSQWLCSEGGYWLQRGILIYCEALFHLYTVETCCTFDYELELDVKTAFLHSDLEEEIYMTQPLWFRAAGKEKLVCKLQKSFYELKQSPRQWYKRFDKFMISCAYTRSLYDPCIYFHKVSSGEYIYLRLYIDDILIASTNRSSIDKLKVRLSSEFEMKDWG